MKEKHLRIPTPDKKRIDGILYGSLAKPLILLVHGLAGNMNEAMHYNAARYFAKHGFSSFRFGLYSFEPKNRKMHECTLKTHGQDIDTVIKFLRSKGAKQIYAVGHSYGLPSILHSRNQDFQAVVSWDGSYLPHSFFKKLPKNLKPKGRFFDEGYFTLLNEAMVKEAREVRSLALIAKLGKKPIKFIIAGGLKKSTNEGVGKKMFNAAQGPKEYVTIKGATHCFFEDGKQEQLYDETVKWLKKI